MTATKPAGPWVIQMRWERLLFAHWSMPVAALRDRIPAGLELDTFMDEAWLGIVLFRMAQVGPAGLPLPGRLGTFGELNVRTYVRPNRADDGPPGVWFFSLDAENPYLVAGGRTVFHLPYFRARIAIAETDELVDYRLRRTHAGVAPASFHARYRQLGEPVHATPGTLEAWLTARFAVYSADGRGQIFRGDIQHDPWRLAPAEWDLEEERLLSGLHLARPDEPPLLQYAADVDVLAAWPVRIREKQAVSGVCWPGRCE